MNTDTKLRQSFQTLRNTDAQRVPAFSRVARAPAPAGTFPWWQLAVGLTAVVTLIIALQIKRQPGADTQPWAALSNWHATTDELLTVASTPWNSTLSTPTDSWIEDSNQTNRKETL